MHVRPSTCSPARRATNHVLECDSASRNGSGDVLQQVLEEEAGQLVKSNHEISLNVADERPIVCVVTYRPAEDSKGNAETETVDKSAVQKTSLSRTRSGRISRPPLYRVRDYKIHRMVHGEGGDGGVDHDNADEDSDGGYKDYDPVGDCPADVKQPNLVQNAVASAALGRRQKDRPCPGCDKSYTGLIGLRHHLKRFPSHDVAGGENEQTDGLSLARPTAVGCSNDANRQRTDKLTKAKAAHRKARLKALVRTCRDDELMEIVGPRLVKAFNSWQFLLARCQQRRIVAIKGDLRGTPATLSSPLTIGGDDVIALEDVEAELADVARSAERLARRRLCECTALVENEDASYFNVTDECAARVMGIATGLYKVKRLKNDDEELPGEDEEDDPDSSVEESSRHRTEEDIVVDDRGVRSPLAVDLLETTASGWSLSDADADKTYSDAAAIQGFELLDMLEQDSLGSLQSVVTSPLL